MKKTIIFLFLSFLLFIPTSFSYRSVFNSQTGRGDLVGVGVSSDVSIVCGSGQVLASNGAGSWTCQAVGGLETDPLSLHLVNESNDVTGGTFNLTTTGYLGVSGINDNAGTPALSIDPNNRYLYLSNGTQISVNYGTSQLIYSGNQITLDWEYGYLNAVSGVLSVDWNNRTLYYSDGITPSMEWNLGFLYDSGGTVRIDYGQSLFYDAMPALFLDGASRLLYDALGTTAMIDFFTATNGVKIMNAYYLPLADGADGYVLTSHNDGTTTWEAGGGAIAFADLTDYPADAAGALTNDGAGNFSWVGYLTAESDPVFDTWLDSPIFQSQVDMNTWGIDGCQGITDTLDRPILNDTRKYFDLLGTTTQMDLSTAGTVLLNNKVGILEGGATPTKYTYFQGGDQTADLTYILPTSSATGFLKNTAGTWSWETTTEIDTLASVTARGATTTVSSTFSGGLLATNATTALTIGAGAAGVDYVLKFDGETNDATITYMEDENFLKLGDTKFVINGTTNDVVYDFGTRTYRMMIVQNVLNEYSFGLMQNYNGAGAPIFGFHKSRAESIVADTESLGAIRWNGWDGDEYVRAAEINVVVHGTPGDEDMPGKFNFSTTPDGGKAPVLAMSIGQDGSVWMVGNCSVLSLTDRTPYYDGDAVKEISAIKGMSDELGSQVIDHATLPKFVQKNGERDLGAMISMLTKAVQQLSERLDKLEATG